MVELRNWFEANGISRKEVAAQLDITVGHLSTLINVNRTPTAVQVDKAMVLMGGVFAVSQFDPHYGELDVEPILSKKKIKKKVKKKATKKVAKKRSKSPLRAMTKFETKFVTDVAEAWILANKGASRDELVEIVRLLSIGIRS
jgi:transcriptional regulator with XRE-family HTH domain